jgi:hypothetical protein
MKSEHILSTLLLAISFSGTGQAAAITLQLNPVNGQVSGAAAQTVGWGFTLSNSGPDFLLVTGTSFAATPLSSFGTYTDLLSPQITAGPSFLVIGPAPEAPSLTEAFNAAGQTGIGEFTFANTAAGSVSGNIVVDYSLFSVSPNDPTFNPDLDTVTPDATVSAPASLSVTASTPEPGTLAMVGIAGLICLLGRRRLRVRT